MLKRASFDSGGKRKIREHLRHFAEKHLAGRKWDVLCMPSHEGFELRQIYEPLRIPQNKIYAVENKQAAARMIEAKFPGVNVVHDDLLKYLQRTNKRFDLKIHIDLSSAPRTRSRRFRDLLTTSLSRTSRGNGYVSEVMTPRNAWAGMFRPLASSWLCRRRSCIARRGRARRVAA